MRAAAARFLPAISWFLRQIAPSVLATLIAAVLISGYNRAFLGHLKQPRMAALHADASAVPADEERPAASTKPAPATRVEFATIYERAIETYRIPDKPNGRDAAKDQTVSKLADAAPVAPPVATRSEPGGTEQQPVEVRPVEARPLAALSATRVAAAPQVMAAPALAPQPATAPVTTSQVTMAPLAAPGVAVPTAPGVTLAVAPAPTAIPREPPPVITAKPMVTVPDRPSQRAVQDLPQNPTQDPANQAQADAGTPPPSHGPLGAIVDTLRPSSLFARAREFGDRIEAVGNDILPNIRQ